MFLNTRSQPEGECLAMDPMGNCFINGCEESGLGRRKRGGEERSDAFILRSPGCRQATILAPVTARLYLPGSGAYGLWPFLVR
jgi:hypothetical protein